MSLPGPTSRVYFSQRLRLHYVDWGNPDAPPLILLHGGRDHCRNWDWVADALRADYHIIAPDLRGHGDSAWSASGHYTMANYIYDLAQLIHQQTLAPVSIVAHSLGGNIALRYTGQQIGWGFHLQSPRFLVGLCVLLFVLGLNLLGGEQFFAARAQSKR